MLAKVDGPYHSPEGVKIVIGNIHTYEVIKQMHSVSGMSQRDFAKRMGVQQATLSRWLTGVQKPPKMAMAAAVFAAISFGIAVRIVGPGKNVTLADKL